MRNAKAETVRLTVIVIPVGKKQLRQLAGSMKGWLDGCIRILPHDNSPNIRQRS